LRFDDEKAVFIGIISGFCGSYKGLLTTQCTARDSSDSIQQIQDKKRRRGGKDEARQNHEFAW